MARTSVDPAPLIVFTHPACAGHDPLPGHAEQPARLQAALDGLGQLDALDLRDAEPIGGERLARVHTAPYLAELDALERRIYSENRAFALDPDTHVGPGSFDAIRRAAGAACQAAEAALAERRSSFAAVRPPGHHAEAGRAMGFCVYNSIALAADAALARPGVERVAVVDFDVHHGNGTEAIFAGRDDVLFLSSHQLPLYPGTGDPAETVARNVHNAALPPGSGSNQFRDAWQADLLPALDRFAPHLILVSAGFDAHWRDPLAQLDLKDEDYFWIGHQLLGLARTHCGGALAASLEGGYDLQALADSVLAFAEGITFEH
ncbi:histone deacetylase family protein [Wenzhouxiangella sp. XN79A]|uniref:histone deacetylase family protein n=1 Tax=Wenzhouxiangella sp. XN79A TaxID=2724193 RepID=UPI00144A55A5|nr:histone deacetylase family protein [Wenzhouxiangella sp. XN79A]NKI34579.1 histone deacetylase family protein [Wenzhouxiangella sp. XN79A]